MTPSAYSAAHEAAIAIIEHLQTHADQASEEITLDLIPDLETLTTIINTAFWASLRREEGQSPTISLAYVPPEYVSEPLLLAKPLRLLAPTLTRMAPAVERPGIHLGIWPKDGNLTIWGAARNLPPFSLVLEVVAPGLMVAKHRRIDGSSKFLNIAVLEGDQIKVIEQRENPDPQQPSLLFSLLGIEAEDEDHSGSSLIQLAISMRAHGHGGLLLEVPAGSEAWRESILSPITYAVVPPFKALTDLRTSDIEKNFEGNWHEAFRRAVDKIAGLTAIDGATVITDDHQLMAFGAKIIRRPGFSQVEHVAINEPIQGSVLQAVNPSQLGGTRHLAAAQFVHDQRDSISLVASQDGRFTVFRWCERDEIVHAHRIESLLL